MPCQVKTGLAEKVLKGDIQAAARLISLIEDGSPKAYDELNNLYPHGGKAYVIGFTGAPGVGKSTLIDALIAHFRSENKTVGVIAVDPTSSRTGGALLGDRVRMQRHGADPHIFIRSLATRGWEGGLARAAIGAVRVMDALGRDIILMETVGSGQVDVDIVRAADTTVLVMTPGAGDEVQAMKAGILEAADIIVVNKADLEGANGLKTDLEAMLGMARDSRQETPIVVTEAVHEKGIAELAGTIQRHREELVSDGKITQRRRERVRLELLVAVEGFIRDGLSGIEAGGDLDRLVEGLVEGKTSPRRAALEIVGMLGRYLDTLVRDRGKDGL